MFAKETKKDTPNLSSDEYLKIAQDKIKTHFGDVLNLEFIAIYMRYSSENQRDNYSIDAQFFDCLNYCISKKYYIVKIYKDEALSGSKQTEKREEFIDMVDALPEKLFTKVVVHKIDRFSRGDDFETAYYKHQLTKNGVIRESVLEPGINDTPEGEMLEKMMEAVARYTARNIGREFLKGLKAKARLGQHPGGVVPLGYNVNGITKKYEINEQEAEIVKKIFSMFNEGKGYQQIIDSFKHFRTKRGNPLNTSALHDILKNEKYIGTFYFNKRAARGANGKRTNRKYKDKSEMIIVDGGIPAIIDKELWNMVQERMDKNKRASGSFKKAAYVFLLSNICYCGLCKGKMPGTSSHKKDKDPVYYYECSRHKRCRDCKMVPVQANYLENAVIRYLKEIFCEENLENLLQWIAKNRKAVLDSKKEKVNKLKNELVNIKNKLNSIVDLLIENPSDTLKAKLRELEYKKNNIESEIKNNSYKVLETNYDPKEYFKHLKKIDTLDRKEQKEIIQNYIDYVEVYPIDGGDKKLKIKSKLDKTLGIDIESLINAERTDIKSVCGGITNLFVSEHAKSLFWNL